MPRKDLLAGDPQHVLQLILLRRQRQTVRASLMPCLSDMMTIMKWGASVPYCGAACVMLDVCCQISAGQTQASTSSYARNVSCSVAIHEAHVPFSQGLRHDADVTSLRWSGSLIMVQVCNSSSSLNVLMLQPDASFSRQGHPKVLKM